MMQKAKKKLLFVIGLFFSGVLGTITSHVQANYSKEDSFFVSTASADITDYTTTTWTGDGCAGCSGGSDSGF